MTDNDVVFDVAIVGGGAAGLSAASVLGRQQRHVLLLDSGDPRNAASPAIHMVLTRDGISPDEFFRLGRAELDEFPGVQRRSAVVEHIGGQRGAFEVTFAGRTVRAKYVLLATGQHDQLGSLPGLSERWGRGVYHCSYCHGFESLDAKIAVLAVRPMDAMIARYLRDRFSQDVVLCAQGLAVDPVPGVSLIDVPVTRITGAEPALQLQLATGDTLECNRVFYRPDATQSNRLAADLGCEINADWAAVTVDAQHQTSVPGVYAVGDCAMNRAAPVPLGFVAAGMGEGQRAAMWIDQALFAETLSHTG